MVNDHKALYLHRSHKSNYLNQIYTTTVIFKIGWLKADHVWNISDYYEPEIVHHGIILRWVSKVKWVSCRKFSASVCLCVCVCVCVAVRYICVDMMLLHCVFWHICYVFLKSACWTELSQLILTQNCIHVTRHCLSVYIGGWTIKPLT
jgi:hypothetical protein